VDVGEELSGLIMGLVVIESIEIMLKTLEMVMMMEE
jgi:hypothetical protein